MRISSTFSSIAQPGAFCYDSAALESYGLRRTHNLFISHPGKLTVFSPLLWECCE